MLVTALPAVAAAGPVVAQDALQEVPAGILAEWSDRQRGLDAQSDDVTRRLVALDTATTDQVRADVGSARADSTEVSAAARFATHAQRARVDLARLELDGAKQEVRVLSSEVRVAKAGGDRSDVLAAQALVSRATGDVAVARGDLATARRQLAAVKRTGTDRKAGTERQLADARSARALVAPPSTERAELQRLLAQAGEERARLELERAVYVNGLGAGLALEPFSAALAEAEASSAAAASRLLEHEIAAPSVSAH
jgi:hypothetical protein